MEDINELISKREFSLNSFSPEDREKLLAIIQDASHLRNEETLKMLSTQLLIEKAFRAYLQGEVDESTQTTIANAIEFLKKAQEAMQQ